MQDAKMHEAMEQFILQRLNDHGSNESPVLTDAYAQFEETAHALLATLNDSQRKRYQGCVDAYSLVDGEALQFYYRAGFSDAVLFFTEWRKM